MATVSKPLLCMDDHERRARERVTDKSICRLSSVCNALAVESIELLEEK